MLFWWLIPNFGNFGGLRGGGGWPVNRSRILDVCLRQSPLGPVPALSPTSHVLRCTLTSFVRNPARVHNQQLFDSHDRAPERERDSLSLKVRESGRRY